MFRSFIHLLEVIPNSTSIMPMTSTYKISPVIVIKQGVFKNLQRTRPVIIYHSLKDVIWPALSKASILQSENCLVYCSPMGKWSDGLTLIPWQNGSFFLGGGQMRNLGHHRHWYIGSVMSHPARQCGGKNGGRQKEKCQSTHGLRRHTCSQQSHWDI